MVSGTTISGSGAYTALRSVAVTLWGVFVAHTVSYWLTHRAAESRAQHLAETGHSHWDVALPTAIAGLVVALLASAFIGWTGRRSRGTSAPISSLQLAMMNVSGFVSMELVERLLSGSGPQHLFTEPALWVGIVASIVVACINALLLRGAHHVGAALAGTSRVARHVKVRRASPRLALKQDLLLYICWTRGPPFATR